MGRRRRWSPAAGATFPRIRHMRVGGLARTPNRGPTSLLSALCGSPGGFGTNTLAGRKQGARLTPTWAAYRHPGSGAAVDADTLAIADEAVASGGSPSAAAGRPSQASRWLHVARPLSAEAVSQIGLGAKAWESDTRTTHARWDSAFIRLVFSRMTTVVPRPEVYETASAQSDSPGRLSSHSRPSRPSRLSQMPQLAARDRGSLREERRRSALHRPRHLCALGCARHFRLELLARPRRAARPLAALSLETPSLMLRR